MNTYKATVADFIRVAGHDIDVYDNYDERLGIAYCPPMELTEEGRKRFARALALNCEWTEGDDDYGTCTVECETSRDAQAAYELFASLAGYCTSEDYDRWFKESVFKPEVELPTVEQLLNRTLIELVDTFVKDGRDSQELYETFKRIGFTDEWISNNYFFGGEHTEVG